MSFIGVGCANKKRCRVRSGLSLSVVLCPLLILQLTSPLVKVNRKSKFVLTCFVDSSGDVAKGYLECHDSVYVASSYVRVLWRMLGQVVGKVRVSHKFRGLRMVWRHGVW